MQVASSRSLPCPPPGQSQGARLSGLPAAAAPAVPHTEGVPKTPAVCGNTARVAVLWVTESGACFNTD